jgi:hypothetical protein
VAVAEVLRDRGHAVEFVVGDIDSADTGASLMRSAGFPVFPIAGVYGWPGPRSFRRQLRALVRRNGYDALHWFEILAGVRDAALVAAAERRAFLWTVTSGGPPVGYYGVNRAVVYTPEVVADLRRRSPDTAVYLLPARMDFRGLDRQFVERARHEVRERLAIADSDLLVVRVARCARLYLQSVFAGIALARRLTASGRPARFLHAGYVDDPYAAEEIRRAVEAANVRAGYPLAVSVTANLEAGTRYTAAADVCIASGRSAIEAAALGRPTLVAWGARYLGMLDEQNIEALAETNFQGRNTERVVDDEDVIAARMQDAVLTRLADVNATQTHEACARFVETRYSVGNAADTYERLYADHAVTIDGFWAYFSNPRYLEREVFHRLPPGIRGSRIMNRLRQSRFWPRSPNTD